MIPKTFDYKRLYSTSSYKQTDGYLRLDDNGYLYGFIPPYHYNEESGFRIVKYNPTDYSEAFSLYVKNNNLYGLATLTYSTYYGSTNYYFDRITYDKDNNYLLTGNDYYHGNYEYLALINKDNGTYSVYNFRTHPSLTAFRTKYSATGNAHLSSMLSFPHRKYQDTTDNGFRFAFVQQNSTVGQTSRVVIGKLYIDSIHASYGIDFNLSSAYQFNSTTQYFQTKDKDNRFYFITVSKGSNTKKYYLNRVSETQLEENIAEVFDFSASTYNYNYIYDMYYDEYSDSIYMTFSYYEMTNTPTGTEQSIRLVKFNCSTKTIEKSQNIIVYGASIANAPKLHVDLKNRLFFGFTNGSGKVDSNESGIQKFFTINMDTFETKIKRFYSILNETYPADRPTGFYSTSSVRCITHKDKYLFYGQGYYYSGSSQIYTYWIMTQNIESMLVQDPEKVQKVSAIKQPGYISNLSELALVKNEKNGYIYRFFNGSGYTPGPKTIQKIDPTTLQVVKTNNYPTATYGQFYWYADANQNNIVEDKNGNYVFFYATNNPAYIVLVINKDDLTATKITLTSYSGTWVSKPYGIEFHHTLSDNSYNCVSYYSSSYEPGIRTLYFNKFFPYDLTKPNKQTAKQLTQTYPDNTTDRKTCFDGVSKIYFVTCGKIASPLNYDTKKRYLNSYDVLTDTLEEKIYIIFESTTEVATINDLYYDNETNSVYISWHTDLMNGGYIDKRKVRYVKFNAVTKTETLSKDISVPGAQCPTSIVPNGDRRFKNYVGYNSSYTPSYMQKERFVAIDMDTFDIVERPYLGYSWSNGRTPYSSTKTNSFTIGNYDYFQGSSNYTLTSPDNGYSIIRLDRRTIMPRYVNQYNEFLYYDNVYFDKSTNTNLSQWVNYDFSSSYNPFCGKSISSNVLDDHYYIDSNDENTLHREVRGTIHLSGLFHTNEKIIIPDCSRNSLIRVSNCDIGVYDPNGNPADELTGTIPAEYLDFEYTVSGRVGLENFTSLKVRTNSTTQVDWTSTWGDSGGHSTFLAKESFYIGNRLTSQAMTGSDLPGGMYYSFSYPNITYNIINGYTNWTYIGYFGEYLQSQMNANTTFKTELTLDVFGQNVVYYCGNGGYAVINYTYNGITNYQFANFIGRPLINTFYIPSNRVIV